MWNIQAPYDQSFSFIMDDIGQSYSKLWARRKKVLEKSSYTFEDLNTAR